MDFQPKLWFDRLLSKSLLRQLGILAVALLISFGLSYVLLSFSGADWQAFCKEKEMARWQLPLYLLIDSNSFSSLYLETHVHGWMLFASGITFLIGAFIFNGAIIGIITNAIEQRVTDHREGRIHYLKSGHFIIMGYDEMVPSIITHIFEKHPGAYILLLSAAESEYIREKLLRMFSEETLEHVIVNYGHRMSKDYYRDIHLECARQIYIVGWRTEQAHDAINVECVDSICDYLQQPGITSRPERITCVFEDLDTYAAFKTSEIFTAVKDLRIEFVPYNFYSGWAKQVFVKRAHRDLDCTERDVEYPFVYGRKDTDGKWRGIDEQDEHQVHLVFVGTTNFAVAFAMEAANVLHFPNFRTKGIKTLITFIDINADKEMEVFFVRNRHFFEVQSHYYRDLSEASTDTVRVTLPPAYFNRKNGYVDGVDNDFLDVDFEFIKGDVFSKRVQHVIREWARDKEHQYLSIFLALPDQRQNFVFGMNMPDEVYDNEIPVFIRQDRSDNFVSNLRAADERIREDGKKNTYVKMVDGEKEEVKLAGRYANIYPFGMNAMAYSADEKSLDRAKLINYLYATADYDNHKFKSVLSLDAMSKTQIMEDAKEPWSKLTVALKWSNLYNAYTLRTKVATLRAMRGLSLDDDTRDLQPLSEEEVKAMAWVEHNRWNVEKLLMGFRKPHKEEDKYVYQEYGKYLKKNKERFIHHDIRPFDKLDNVHKLDYEFSRYIPWIMKMTQDKKE